MFNKIFVLSKINKHWLKLIKNKNDFKEEIRFFDRGL